VYFRGDATLVRLIQVYLNVWTSLGYRANKLSAPCSTIGVGVGEQHPFPPHQRKTNGASIENEMHDSPSIFLLLLARGISFVNRSIDPQKRRPSCIVHQPAIKQSSFFAHVLHEDKTY